MEIVQVLPMLEEIVSILEAAEEIDKNTVGIKVPKHLVAYFDKVFPGCKVLKEEKTDE
jgi:hypothetical protein